MWPRKRLDIDWRDLACALWGCVNRADHDGAAHEVESEFCDDGHTLSCLSVRSGFDLFLATVNLPRGSEVLVSAITIPDMVQIIEHHGLVPVPIDVDPAAGVPPAAEIVRAATPKTRAVLIAHLFGAAPALDEQIAAARERGLVLIEDCAQAFRGVEFIGHPQADLSMFSFGTIKRATALGGAILRIRDTDVLGQMRDRQAVSPLQSRFAYLRRLLRYSLLKALESRLAFGSLVSLPRLLGRDHDRWVNSLVRGFPPGQMFRLIRTRPASPLLRLLTRRLNGFDLGRQQRRSMRGRRLAETIHETIECPTAFEEPHGFWVFPISIDAPESIRQVLLAHGFDSTQGQSMIVVSPPDDREQDMSAQAQELFRRLLFLPFYDSLPDAELDRMAGILRDQFRDSVQRSPLS